MFKGRASTANGALGGRYPLATSVKSCLVWPLFMPLTCPLASCPETDHPLFVSTHVANSWTAGAAERSGPPTAPQQCAIRPPRRSHRSASTARTHPGGPPAAAAAPSPPAPATLRAGQTTAAATSALGRTAVPRRRASPQSPSRGPSGPRPETPPTATPQGQYQERTAKAPRSARQSAQASDLLPAAGPPRGPDDHLGLSPSAHPAALAQAAPAGTPATAADPHSAPHRHPELRSQLIMSASRLQSRPLLRRDSRPFRRGG